MTLISPSYCQQQDHIEGYFYSSPQINCPHRIPVDEDYCYPRILNEDMIIKLFTQRSIQIHHETSKETYLTEPYINKTFHPFFFFLFFLSLSFYMAQLLISTGQKIRNYLSTGALDGSTIPIPQPSSGILSPPTYRLTSNLIKLNYIDPFMDTGSQQTSLGYDRTFH